MGESKLSNPRVHVIMVDGTEWDVQALNIDLLRWERTAAKHKWPDFQSVPLWWMSFLAWSAGTRGGQLPAGTTWEAFSEQLCAQVSDPNQGKPAEGGTAVPPTDAAVGTG